MPAGASAKREREFKELESKFKKERRYPGREEEVAARIVNKQRARYGETKADRDGQGRSPERGLPVPDYRKLTIPQILARIEGLPPEDMRAIRAYEVGHKNRTSLVAELDRRIGDDSGRAA